MPDDRTRSSDEQRSHAAKTPKQSAEHKGRERHVAQTPPATESASTQATTEVAVQASSSGEIGLSPSYKPALLDDSRLAARGNGSARIALMTEMQQAYGNRAVQRFLHRPSTVTGTSVQRQWPDAAKSGAASSVVTPPANAGWNSGDVQIGNIWRIPVSDLKKGNKHDDSADSGEAYDDQKHVSDITDEKSDNRAIVLVPDQIKAASVDVLLYLHGFGSGYRQRKTARTFTHKVEVEDNKTHKNTKKDVTEDVPGMEAGTVRDVDVDHMEAQLQNSIKANNQPMVAVMPQGAYVSNKDRLSFGYFQSDAYLDDVFAKVGKLKGITRARVVLAGHSGAGGTIGPMLGEAVDDRTGNLKTDAEIKKAGKVRYPSGLAEVMLFDAINGPGERSYVENWIRAQVRHDLGEIKNKVDTAGAPDVAAQKAYLATSMRFRGYHSALKGYTATYNTLKENVEAIIKQEIKRAKLKVDADVEKAIRDNYQNGIQGVATGHETLMGTGKVEEGLSALPKPPAPSAPATTPTTTPAQPTLSRRVAGAPGLAAVQRDVPVGTVVNLVAADVAQKLITATVGLGGGNGTLLLGDDIRRGLDNRASNVDLNSVFNEAVRYVGLMSGTNQQAAIDLQAREIVRVLENQFILNPQKSSLDLLPPARAEHYKDFSWHRLDYPGQNTGDPAGPHENEARAMSRELSAVRPEKRGNQGDDAVVTQGEFDARMRRFVESELIRVPGQGTHRLNRHAADSFVQMAADAANDGVTLTIGAASRTPERAAANADRSGNSSAVGRFSTHILGLAMDLDLSYGTVHYAEQTTRPMQNVVDMRESPGHKWMFLRGATYGWYPLQNEPWHWEYNPTGFHDTFRENMQAAATGGRPAAGGNANPAPRTLDSEVPPSLQRKVASELKQNGLAINVQRKPGPTEAAFDAIEGAVGGVIGGVAGAVGTAGKMLGSLASAAASGALVPVTITFGPNAVQDAVSENSLGILRDILRAAGLTSATITSTARTANDQARVMYDNLENKGIAHQKALYGPTGDQVIDAYSKAKKAGKSPADIKAAMEAKINEIGPSKVSNHCADPAVLNVFDVGPISIGDAAANEAFKRAARAEVGKRVSRFIPYPQDPGHHFEIKP